MEIKKKIVEFYSIVDDLGKTYETTDCELAAAIPNIIDFVKQNKDKLTSTEIENKLEEEFNLPYQYDVFKLNTFLRIYRYKEIEIKDSETGRSYIQNLEDEVGWFYY